MLASGFYHTGLLRVTERLARSYEVRLPAGKRIARWARVSRSKYVILSYHRVGTDGVPLFSRLPAEEFEAQMRFLRRHYRIVSLEEVFHGLQEPEVVRQAVAITFDDGYRDLYTQALPILKTYRVPATIFLSVDAIETGRVAWYDRIFFALQVAPQDAIDLRLDRPCHFRLGSSEERIQAAVEIVSCLRDLPDSRREECCMALEKQAPVPDGEPRDCMLTWEQIREMQQAGIRFGSHTMTHRVLSRLTPAEVEGELRQSRRVLEQKLDTAVTDFAFPFGKPSDCGSETPEILARCGYRLAVTTSPGVNTPDANRYGLRRSSIGETGSLPSFALNLNRLFLAGGPEEPVVARAKPVLLAGPAGRSAGRSESRV